MIRHLLLALGLACMAGVAAAAEELNVYSSRHYDTDAELYAEFTEQTGIKINLIEGKDDALIERLKAEGDNSPADVFITVDAGRLWRADDAGLFQPVSSDVLEARIPANLRHPDGHWFGITKRARVIIYNTDNGKPEGLNDYEDLAKPAFDDMVCIRSSSNIYNQSLVASLIANHGLEKTEAWLKGFVGNFARPPQGNDTAQIAAVSAGECPLGIVNTYYVGRQVAAESDIGKNIGIIFPNQDDRGTHINISGIGVTTTAKNKEAAVKFIEFLTTPEAQRLFAHANNEYPVVEGIEGPESLQKFGDFKQDDLSASVVGELNPEAVKAMDRAGWK